MNGARFLVAVLILVGATLAACSGNFGSGTTPPNGLLPSGNLAGINPTPSPTPNSASNIVTYGSSTAFQPLPSAGGYGGAIAFPAPARKPSGFTDIAVGATISVIRPTDAPDLNLVGKGKKGKKRDRPARSLVYITLLPTHDMTLATYPRIAIDVPRDIVTIYRENEFGIALYNAGTKDTAFRLAAAELDTATPPPTPTPNPSAPPPPTAIPVSASAAPSGTPTAPASPAPSVSGATPAASSAPGARGAPTSSAAPGPSPTLPPQRIVFAGTAATLKLVANRPVVFVLYALPVGTPPPSPRASGMGAASPQAGPSASPAAAGSPVATGSPAASAAPVPVPART
ncbi:MAG TPA: hypothetical protein VIJ64_02885 [Candidatus Lustribacter sp.]